MRVFCTEFDHFRAGIVEVNTPGVLNEDAGRCFPGMGGRKLDAGLARDAKGLHARRLQI